MFCLSMSYDQTASFMSKRHDVVCGEETQYRFSDTDNLPSVRENAKLLFRPG